MDPVPLIHDTARLRHAERLARSLAAYPTRGLKAACLLEQLALRIAGRRRMRRALPASLAS